MSKYPLPSVLEWPSLIVRLQPDISGNTLPLHKQQSAAVSPTAMNSSSSSRLATFTIALSLAISFTPSVMAAKPEDEPKKEQKSSSPSLKLSRQSSQTSSTQNQNVLGNALGNAVSPTSSLFNAGEWQIIGYGIGGTGSDTNEVTTERTVKSTTTVTSTRYVTRTTYQSTLVPSILAASFYVTTPVQTTVPVTTKKKVTTYKKVKSTKNVAGIQGGFGGIGTEARYFFTRWLGVGVEGDWLEGEGTIGTTLTTITARLIKDSNAYYAFGGTGVQFDEHRTQSIGKLGLGMEHRFVASTSVFADAAWMFGSEQSAAVFRGGFKFSF
ncbi:hypothetical protein BH11VER1_BH11VER1_22130 [soil metagenome]